MVILSEEDSKRIRKVIEVTQTHLSSEYEGGRKLNEQIYDALKKIVTPMDIEFKEKALKFLESKAYKTIYNYMDSVSESLSFVNEVLQNSAKISDEAFEALTGDAGEKYIQFVLNKSFFNKDRLLSPRMLGALNQKEFVRFTEVNHVTMNMLSRLNDFRFTQLLEGLKQNNFMSFIGKIDGINFEMMQLYFSDDRFSKLVSVMCDPRFKLPSGSDPFNWRYIKGLPDIDFDKIDKFIANPKTGGEWIKSKTSISTEPYRDNGYSDVPFLSTEQSILNFLCRLKVNGPWAAPGSDEKRMNKVMDKVIRDPAFGPLLDVVAMHHFNNENNIAKFYQQPFFLTHLLDAISGWADHNVNIHMPVYAPVRSQVETTAHELGHASIMVIFNNDAQPYNYEKEGRDNFEEVMRSSVINLHKRFVPGIVPPHDITELLESLDEHYLHNSISEKRIPKDLRNVIGTLTKLAGSSEDKPYSSTPEEYTKKFLGSLTALIKSRHYTKDSYHIEFVVKLPEALATFGSLPPHIAECLEPLINDYRTRITPAAHKVIDDHHYKAILIRDKIKPETFISLSGEDELMAKKVLTEGELELVKKIEAAQEAVKLNSIEDLNEILEDAEEMVVRSALKAYIKHHDDRLQMFEATLAKITAPQFLGPQLLTAARLNKTDVAMKLITAMEDQYYLAKTAEIAMENGNLELLQQAMSRVDNPWFLVSTVDKTIEFDRSSSFVKSTESAGKPQMNDLLLSELIKKKEYGDIDHMMTANYLKFDHVCQVMAQNHFPSKQLATQQYWDLPHALNPMTRTAISSGCAARDIAHDQYAPAMIIATAALGLLLWKAIKGIDGYLRKKPASSHVDAVRGEVGTGVTR